jgi:hypothetical protein
MSRKTAHSCALIFLCVLVVSACGGAKRTKGAMVSSKPLVLLGQASGQPMVTPPYQTSDHGVEYRRGPYRFAKPPLLIVRSVERLPKGGELLEYSVFVKLNRPEPFYESALVSFDGISSPSDNNTNFFTERAPGNCYGSSMNSESVENSKSVHKHALEHPIIGQRVAIGVRLQARPQSSREYLLGMRVPIHALLGADDTRVAFGALGCG